jgi:hypothetical protein
LISPPLQNKCSSHKDKYCGINIWASYTNVTCVILQITFTASANNIVMSSVSIGPEKKRTCAHPLHGDSKAKSDRGINAVMSREIWLRLQLVVAIDVTEGNLQRDLHIKKKKV